MRFVVLDADGVAIGAGSCRSADLALQAPFPGQRAMELPENMRPPPLDGSARWDSAAGAFVTRIPPALLEAMRSSTIADIDAAAEAVRQAGVTPGTGQAREYQRTEEEARRWLAEARTRDPGFAGYPMLSAEVLAVLGLETAGPVPSVTVGEIAQQVVARADAEVARLARIKHLRRAAKIAAAAATTPGQLRDAARIDWPR